MVEERSDILEGQPCPVCNKNTLTLREMSREVPFFGLCYIFSMDCSECDYLMADVETDNNNEPVKVSLDVESEEDLNIKIVKSSQASVKIPRLIDITPGPISSGYITNVEGILNRVKKIIESKSDDEDPSVRKKAKSHLKKIQRVLWGREKITIIITDPTGNSAIISDKAKKG